MKPWNAALFVVGVTVVLSDLSSGQSPLTQRPLTQRPLTQRPLTQRPLTQRPVNQPPVTEPLRAARRGPHAGRLLASGGFQLEVVFSNRSVEIFVFDRDGQPVKLRDVRGRIAFVFAADQRTFRYDIYSPGEAAPSPNRLYLAVDLSRVPDRGVSVDVVLQGLDQRPIEFATPFQRTQTVEQIAIQRQRICPVSGKLLGSMGKPVKVSIDKRDVYVCCAGCASPLQKNPKVHLAKLAPQPPANANKADATAVALQRICPVSGEPLNSMGGAWKVMVQNEPVFVCCKGCIRKVQERPALYLGKVSTAGTRTSRR